MLHFLHSLFVMIGTIHQACEINAVPHGKSMTQFMVNNLNKKIYINFIFILNILLSFVAIAFLYYLFERNYACPILD